jgi:hypothetical protein
MQTVIGERFSQKRPITYSGLPHELELEFGIMLLSDILRHIMRSIPGCKTIRGVPQKASRVMYDEREIDEYNMLESLITGAPAAIVYNVVEVGFDLWVDASRMVVVVTSSYPGTEIAVPVARGDSLASMIACVVRNGRSLKPYIVMPRKTLEVELYESGFPPESCCIAYQEKGFVTSQLFNDCLEKVLIPDVIIQRKR